jgi:hypothetical protein
LYLYYLKHPYVSNLYKRSFKFYLVQSLSHQKLFITLEIVALIFVSIALVAEVLPEVKAKLIVIPALILALTVSIIRIQKKL